jgi:hypothetical protein
MTVNPDFEDDETGDPHDGELIIRAKGTIDDAVTLEEAAAKAEEFAAALWQLAAEGWELTHPVDGDYGFLVQKPGTGDSS